MGSKVERLVALVHERRSIVALARSGDADMDDLLRLVDLCEEIDNLQAEWTTALSFLRTAAVEWAEAHKQEPTDDQDGAFKKLDEQLQEAAIAFAKTIGHR